MLTDLVAAASTSAQLAQFLTESAPWITAVGAVLLGFLSHSRRVKTDEQEKFQRTIEELHGLYHNLVADLSEQVERVRGLNIELAESNEELTRTVSDLRDENANLIRSVKTLTRRINALEKIERDHDAKGDK